MAKKKPIDVYDEVTTWRVFRDVKGEPFLHETTVKRLAVFEPNNTNPYARPPRRRTKATK